MHVAPALTPADDNQCISSRIRKHPNRPLDKLLTIGCLLRIREATWHAYRDKMGHIRLLLHHLEYVAGGATPEEAAIHGEPRCLYCIPAVGELLRQRLLGGPEGNHSAGSVEEDEGGQSRREVASAMIQMLEGPSQAADNASDPLADIGEIPGSQQEALEEIPFFHPSPATVTGSLAAISPADYFGTLRPISRSLRYDAWPTRPIPAPLSTGGG